MTAIVKRFRTEFDNWRTASITPLPFPKTLADKQEDCQRVTTENNMQLTDYYETGGSVRDHKIVGGE